MTSPCTCISVVALAIVSSLMGCASASREGTRTSPEPASHTMEPRAKPRPEAARYPYTAADVQFMSHMIHHHAQAIVMAALVPTRGASPSVKTLAERIINAQQDEIATMQQWLGDRGQPVPEVQDSVMSMDHSGSGHEARHEMLMPGMLTKAQLQELDRARGREFDRLFLTSMIQHHRGAVSMVKDLFGSPGAAQDETVFKFANDVSVDQSTEIARMETMLAALTH